MLLTGCVTYVLIDNFCPCFCKIPEFLGCPNDRGGIGFECIAGLSHGDSDGYTSTTSYLIHYNMQVVKIFFNIYFGVLFGLGMSLNSL